jgi:hypothetical protein
MHELTERERERLNQLRCYQNQWVAVVEDEHGDIIVGSGKDAVGAKADARSKGHEDVVLFWVRPANMHFIGGALAA